MSPDRTPKTRKGRKVSKASQPSSSFSPATAPGAEGMPQSPSVSRLLDHSRQTTEDWYKSSNTKKGYAGYVKRGKQWVLDWAGSAQLESDGQSATYTGNLAQAFDTISKHTPMALRLLTAFKCDHQGNHFATAEGIRVLGCQGEYWKYNSHTNEWEGNPVFESDYCAYYESLKNQENRTATSTQALPMLPKDLKVLFDFLDSLEGCKQFTLTQRLYFKAFASTAFNLWTRNDELIHFLFKDLKLALVSDSGVRYIEFRLIFRKTNKDPNKVQVYRIPFDPNHPEYDCYTHMTAWIAHLQGLLQRPLVDSDCIFPGIASTGQLKFGESTSRTGIENLLDSIVDASGLMLGRRGKFTTHCFRRGGAQYRFTWADRKWSLKAVKWWGGWSSSENVGTIMRYLLDELMAYGEGFTDIMMPDRATHRHESFMGTPDAGEGISRTDMMAMEHRMVQRIEDIAKSWIATPPATPQPQYRANANSSMTDAMPVFQRVAEIPPAAPESSPQTPSRLRPSRIPEVNSLDDVIRYWEKGDTERGLVTPLKDWSQLFDPKEYKSEAVKLSNIRFVYEEFSGQCSSSYDTFESSFPGLRRQYTKLLQAVRTARKTRGEAKSRKRR